MKAVRLKKLVALVLSLMILCTALPLQTIAYGTEEDIISVSPTKIDFGTDIKTARAVTVENVSSETITLDEPISVNSYLTLGALSKTVLLPGEIASFTVKPADKDWSPAKWSDEILIWTTDRSVQQKLSVEFTIAESEVISVEPSRLDFGTDIKTAKAVVVKNVSSENIILAEPVSSYSRFTLGVLSSSTLLPGETATFTVVPADASWRPGEWSDDIVISSKDGTLLTRLFASFTVTEYPTTKGWYQDASGNWMYYYSDSVYATGWKNDIPGWSGQWFYFNEQGKMQTGWQSNIPGWSGSWFYFNPNGTMATGWKNDIPGWNGQWFYFATNGVMATGWRDDIPNYVGKRFYFATNGVMATGWRDDIPNYTGKRFYFDTNGVMATGWKLIDKEWYYFDTNGVMMTGWQFIGSNWYYLDKDGTMVTGWLFDNGKWYYLNSSGIMVKGNQIIDGTYYYFNAKGELVGE